MERERIDWGQRMRRCREPLQTDGGGRGAASVFGAVKWRFVPDASPAPI